MSYTTKLKGLFITLEGGEGAGKTTLAEGLKRYLESKGRKVLVTREPGGTKLGEKIRDLLLHKDDFSITARTELFLFLAARSQHLEEVIIPALKQGICVICDRFNDSTIAYQGGGRKLGVEYITAAIPFATGGIEPHLTFFLDVDPSIGKKRIKKREQKIDRIEKEAQNFHRRVRNTFVQLAKEHPKRIFCIDGTKTKEQVLNEATKHL